MHLTLPAGCTDLEFVYKFDYFAQFGALGSERELCSVYVESVSSEVHPNPTEIDATRWPTSAELDTEIASGADDFTPWLRLEWAELRGRGLV